MVVGGRGYHTHLRIALKRSLAIVIGNMGVDISGESTSNYSRRFFCISPIRHFNWGNLMVVGELKILIQMRHCKCCYFTQCLLQQLLPHQLPFLLPAGSCLAQRSGYICPPKKIHYPFMLVWKQRRYYYFRI